MIISSGKKLPNTLSKVISIKSGNVTTQVGKEDGLLFAFCYGIVAVTYACYKFYLDNWRDEDDD